MKSRLTRPLLAVVIGGAVFAGSAVAGPAFAAPVPDSSNVAADQPLPQSDLPKAISNDDTGNTGGSTGGSTGGDTGGSTGGNTGGSTGGDTGGSTGGNTGGNTGGSTGGSTGGDTGGSTGGNTGGSTGGNTGGSTGGNTGGSTGGDTGGSTGGNTGTPNTSSSSAPPPGGPGNPPANPPTTDTTAPAGKFSLSSSAPWIGQFITLTQVGVADNGVADPAAVKRVVTWGDGSAPSTILPKQAPRKSFTKVGTFKVTLTLTDAAGNKREVSWPVKVSSPVKAALDKSSVWHGQRFNVRFSNVPAGTTRITLRYGDGTGIHLAGKNQVVGGIYHRKPNGQIMPPGPVTLTAVYTNRLGATSQVPIGRITIKNDVWVPRTTITRPKNANRVSSWKTVRGTATDQGSGVQFVQVVAARLTSSGAVQCYTKGQSWLTIRNEAHFAQCGVLVRAVKGKWSLSLRGMKKGEFAVIATAVDWADQIGNDADVETNLTRN